MSKSDHAASLFAGAFAGAVSTGIGLLLSDQSIDGVSVEAVAGAAMGISAISIFHLMNFRTPNLVLTAGYLTTSLGIIFATSQADAAITTLQMEGESCKSAFVAQGSAQNAKLVLPAGCKLKM